MVLEKNLYRCVDYLLTKRHSDILAIILIVDGQWHMFAKIPIGIYI
jgi:hypothetical protein